MQWQAHRSIIKVSQLLDEHHCLVCISIDIVRRAELSKLGARQLGIGIRGMLGSHALVLFEYLGAEWTWLNYCDLGETKGW